MKAMLAVIALSAAAVAQEPNPRFEFLWRLRQLEARVRNDVKPDTRAKALDSVVKAQALYAGGRTSDGCSALDDAASLLVGRTQTNWNDSFAVVPVRRLCDRNEKAIAMSFALYYRPCNMQSVVVSAHFDDRKELFDYLELDTFNSKGPWHEMLPLVGAPVGDRGLALSLFNGDFVDSVREMTISIVEHRDERLAALKTAIEKLSEKAPVLERATAQATLALLESLARGSTEAHEYPGARLLAEAEQVVAAAAIGERWYTPDRSGEFWLSLPIDGARVRTRVLVPEGLSKDKSAPIVVAFHGAAFDEDVWFDGYAAGAAVEACRKRGWLFAAVHSDGEDAPQRVDAIVAALSKTYPVDAKHVFLLGHSRGARTALRAYAAKPDAYRAAAAIGNALDDAAAKPLANHPLFLAAGDHDFAREAVTAMHKALTDAGSKTVKLTICPNTEHWLAVQAALPDAFAWFDSLAK